MSRLHWMGTPMERLMGKTRKTKSCWIWQGSTRGDGYGQIHYMGAPTLTHRLSYLLFKGKIGKKKYVLHSCDVRACVNPSHLYLGDHARNMMDMAERRRSNIGIKHPMAKLTPTKVSEIRKLSARGYSQRMLAKKYSVSQKCICYAVRGETWCR